MCGELPGSAGSAAVVSSTQVKGVFRRLLVVSRGLWKDESDGIRRAWRLVQSLLTFPFARTDTVGVRSASSCMLTRNIWYCVVRLPDVTRPETGCRVVVVCFAAPQTLERYWTHVAGT